MNKVICKKCKEERCEDEFFRDRSRPSGRHPYCRHCVKKDKRARYQQNVDHCRALERKARARYRAKLRKDPEKWNNYLAKQRELRSKHYWTVKEFREKKKREARLYRRTEKGKNVYNKSYKKYLSNPENILKHAARTKARRVFGKAKKCVFANDDCYGPFEFHHYNGYKGENALKVVEVCQGHHKLLDNFKIEKRVILQYAG